MQSAVRPEARLWQHRARAGMPVRRRPSSAYSEPRAPCYVRFGCDAIMRQSMPRRTRQNRWPSGIRCPISGSARQGMDAPRRLLAIARQMRTRRIHIELKNARYPDRELRPEIRQAPGVARLGLRMTTNANGLACGGPTRTRTWNQGIRVLRRFPPGADYLFTLRRCGGWGAGRSSLSSRALKPPGSLCTFRRCTAGSAQDCHQPPVRWKVSLNSSRPPGIFQRRGTFPEKR